MLWLETGKTLMHICPDICVSDSALFKCAGRYSAGERREASFYLEKWRKVFDRSSEPNHITEGEDFFGKIELKLFREIVESPIPLSGSRRPTSFARISTTLPSPPPPNP